MIDEEEWEEEESGPDLGGRACPQCGTILTRGRDRLRQPASLLCASCKTPSRYASRRRKRVRKPRRRR